ncbi:MAG TPA: hypothetical protein PKE31_02625 [Pseudomonadota bacterium]|nr:hypothetical protein [Pseudomonadota bacterium]
MRDVYSEWGFLQDPFDSDPIPMTDSTVPLLVDREEESRKIVRHLYARSNCLSLRGSRGIGKTSLVTLSVFNEFSRYKRTDTARLLLPCRRTFRCAPGVNPALVTDNIHFQLARTLLENRSCLGKNALPGYAEVCEWFSAPHTQTLDCGLEVLRSGICWERDPRAVHRLINGRASFYALICRWLEDAFPRLRPGGLVCMLDDVDLLGGPNEARSYFDELRSLFFQTGLRWVLCCEGNILNDVLSFPSTLHYLAPPMMISSLSPALIAQVYERRVRFHAEPDREPRMPLAVEDFVWLVAIFCGDMAMAFAAADNFCVDLFEQSLIRFPQDLATKRAAFAAWIEARIHRILDDLGDKLSPQDWESFDRVVKLRGSYLALCQSFRKREDLFKAIRPLYQIGLLTGPGLERGVVDGDVTPTEQGWLLAHHRKTTPKILYPSEHSGSSRNRTSGASA